MIDNIYNMKLHDEFELWPGLTITRVPGGWIYRTEAQQPGGWYINQCFVPFNNEFLESIEKKND